MIIGIDPDSKAHGVAVYKGGKLVNLYEANNVGLVERIKNDCNHMVFSIEDVCANKFVYGRNNKGGKSLVSNIAMKVGRCQQAQLELMNWLDYLKITYVLHKPQKSNWAKNKAQFEKVTGWNKRSNEDTRSAAYFGYLEVANYF